MGLFALPFLIALAASSAVPARQPITATDLLRIRSITEVQLAPDGSFAIFGVRSIQTAQEGQSEPVYSYQTHLWYIDLTKPDSSPRQLTFGDRRDSGIALSPNGKRLAFMREDPESKKTKKTQVWVMEIGAPGEARQLTHFEHGAEGPAWHPNGKSLLVSSEIPISKIEGKPEYNMERPARAWGDFDRPSKDVKIDARPDGDRRAIRNWLEQNASKDNPTVIHRLAFQAEQGLRLEATVARLFQIDAEADQTAKPLTKGFYPADSYSFSPDGKSIAFVSYPKTDAHPDRVQRHAVWIMNADGSGLKTLLDSPGEDYQSVRWYPDGRALLVTSQQTDEPTFRQIRLGKYDVAADRMLLIAKGWDSSVNDAKIASNGGVLFTSNWHGGAPLKLSAGERMEDLVAGPVGVTEFDEADGRIVYAQVSVANPNELFLREKDGTIRQLTELNARWLAGKILSLPTEKWIQRPDGSLVQSWIMNPAQAQSGKKYPFVLDMHGGPHAMWGPGEFTMWHEFQLLCAWGYGVVYSNPRGSTGYGYQTQKANYKDWAVGPAGDALAALDDAIATNPYVDPQRLFLTGGSYAGYLTAWIVSQDHRFKAAAAQRGVYDFTTFYGEGNAYRLVKHSFGGMPYEAEVRRLLDRQSPFSQVQQIRTPLLILHGSEDQRTGVSQSEMLYRALKDLGRPVEYVRYPGVGHELTRSGPPQQRMDHALRIIEFFERYSNNDAPAPVTPR